MLWRVLTSINSSHASPALFLPAQDSWSPEEDAKLRQLHAQYGTSWSRISKCLKGRTSQQCRARWHQINNGRSRSGAPAGSSSGGSGKQQAVSQQLLQPLFSALSVLPLKVCCITWLTLRGRLP